jgi:hypothetical protein
MGGPIRALALEHFSGQDLDALTASPKLAVRRIPYTRFRDPAIRILGEDVGAGLERFWRDDLEPRRRRYETWLEREMRRLFIEWPFDVVLLPSDVFFYVRALPHAAHLVGASVVVVQKETTISPATAALHSREIARHAAFVSDVMTVCSDQHKAFWVATGADSSSIHVTGQPRFDLYAAAREGLRTSSGRPRVLFLSYELDAYEPGAGQGRGGRTWETLRDGTEHALLALAKESLAQVVVKHHPQQDFRTERRRLRRLTRGLARESFRIVDPDEDTRTLIVEADVVVGFQTTALFESVAAGRPTVYAAWGEAFVRSLDGLIPFHTSACVTHAKSPAALVAALREPKPPPDGCQTWYEEVLGPVDGFAVARTVDVISRVVGEKDSPRWNPPNRRGRAMLLMLLAVADELRLQLAAPLARVLGRSRGLRIRLGGARDRRRRLWSAVRESA